MRAKNIYFGLLFAALAIGLYTILKLTPLETVFLNSATLLSFFQRLFGLWAFTLLFFQILLGSGMFKNAQKFGSWVHKVHTTQGLFAYAFVFFHPFSYLALLTQTTKSFNPFYVYTDFCILCRTRPELFYSFGRVAFWILTFTVTAAAFRTRPLFRRNWKLVHNLNYVAFFAVGIHAWYIGSETQLPPYVWFHVFAISAVSGIVLTKLIRLVIGFIKTVEVRKVVVKN